MYLKKIRIFGFKRFRKTCVSFAEGSNILVGGNDSGKSTLPEAITAVIDGQYRSAPLMRSMLEDLFNKEIVDKYLKQLDDCKSCEAPKLLSRQFLLGMMKWLSCTKAIQ